MTNRVGRRYQLGSQVGDAQNMGQAAVGQAQNNQPKK
mgnify:FL=1